MSYNKVNPEYAPDEKKVWRGVTISPCEKPSEDFPDGAYFMAIEELQGAWVGNGDDKHWEEAEGGTEEWDESYVDDDGETRIRTVTSERLRARRYVLKMFTSEGSVKNAYSGYSGARRYNP